jgi:hypothetical protein
MLQQQWIIVLTTPTIIANIASFEHRILSAISSGGSCRMMLLSVSVLALLPSSVSFHLECSKNTSSSRKCPGTCSEATSIAPAVTRLYSAAARPHLPSAWRSKTSRSSSIVLPVLDLLSRDIGLLWLIGLLLGIYSIALYDEYGCVIWWPFASNDSVILQGCFRPSFRWSTHVHGRFDHLRTFVPSLQ